MPGERLEPVPDSILKLVFYKVVLQKKVQRMDTVTVTDATRTL